VDPRLQAGEARAVAVEGHHLAVEQEVVGTLPRERLLDLGERRGDITSRP
jgi:hypothetical protein